MARKLDLAHGSGHAIAKITCPTREVAERLAHEMVSSRVAACVNLVSDVCSIYSWQGKICQDQEVLLFVKTRWDAADRLLEIVAKCHPYDVPEVLWTEVVKGQRSYLDWMDETMLGQSDRYD